MRRLYHLAVPRYVVERTYTVDPDALPAVAARSKAIRHYHYPEIVWEHSHVVMAADGTPKSFCIYEAPNEEMVLEHSKLLGDHFIETIYEIAGDITPDDFPLTADPVQQS
jgi:Nickel responsive protein SCO4226-like